MDAQRRINESGRLDFERLRAGHSRWDWPTAEAGSDALPAFLGRVVTADSRPKLGRFCRVEPTVVLGDEREGGRAAFAPAVGGSAGATTLVYLIGSRVPAAGEYLVCRFVDHRWVAECGGAIRSKPGDGVTLKGCSCPVPRVLRMTSRDPACNYGMFQSCTLEYGPAPALMAAFGATDSMFTSGATFVDPITGASFFYHFECSYNQFFLTRVFPESPFGSPYRDGILYAWVVGGYLNTCDPFFLHSGTAFPGSDASCSISISG